MRTRQPGAWPARSPTTRSACCASCRSCSSCRCPCCCPPRAAPCSSAWASRGRSWSSPTPASCSTSSRRECRSARTSTRTRRVKSARPPSAACTSTRGSPSARRWHSRRCGSCWPPASGMRALIPRRAPQRCCVRSGWCSCGLVRPNCHLRAARPSTHAACASARRRVSSTPRSATCIAPTRLQPCRPHPRHRPRRIRPRTRRPVHPAMRRTRMPATPSSTRNGRRTRWVLRSTSIPHADRTSSS